MRKLLAVLILVVGGTGVAAALSRGPARSETSTFSRPGPVSRLEVEVDAGTVEVVAGEATEIHVQRTRKWSFGGPRVTERVSDGVLRLTGRCRAFGLVDCRVDYRVEVPSEAAVRVRVDAGRIEVGRMVGVVDVGTDAGAIRLAGTAGPVKASADAGSIEGDDLSPPTLEASTDAGAISLTLARPPSRTDLRASAGSIDVGLPEGTYRVDARSDVGPVEVSVVQDPGSSRTVVARTSAGAIRIHRR